MNNLIKKKNDIIKVLVGFNIIVFIIFIFYRANWLIFTSLITNIILPGTYLVINKYAHVFEALYTANKMLGGVNNLLGKM